MRSAFKNIGVQSLLDAIIEFMPSPNDVPAITGILDNEKESYRNASDKEPFSATNFSFTS